MKNIIKTVMFTPGRLASVAASRNGGTSLADRQRWGLDVVIWDIPGTGKTTAVERWGTELGLEVHTVVLGQASPEDVGGYPVPQNGTVRKAPDEWVYDVNRAKRALVVFDEFSLDPARQAAALRVFSDRCAGSYRLNPSVRTIALANPPEFAAVPYKLRPATANRFGHLQWEGFSVDSFTEFLAGGAGAEEVRPLDPEKLEEQVLAAWPDAYGHAVSVVAGFLRAKPELYKNPPRSTGNNAGENDDLRWPSPRIWEVVTRAVAGARIHKLDEEETSRLIGAFLPAGAAATFYQYLREQHLPSPEWVVAHPDEVEIDRRLDRTMAILLGTAMYVQQSQSYKAAVGWWALAERVSEHKFGGVELVLVPAKTVIKAGFGPTRVEEISTAFKKRILEILHLGGKYA